MVIFDNFCIPPVSYDLRRTFARAVVNEEWDARDRFGKNGRKVSSVSYRPPYYPRASPSHLPSAIASKADLESRTAPPTELEKNPPSIPIHKRTNIHVDIRRANTVHGTLSQGRETQSRVLPFARIDHELAVASAASRVPSTRLSTSQPRSCFQDLISPISIPM